MKDDDLYLKHIIESMDRILEYTEEGRDHFMADRRTQDAVIRNIEIIGEAVKGLSPQARSTNPDIPWRRIAGMRDKLIHEYFGVNLELVWETVISDIPWLKVRIGTILEAKVRDLAGDAGP